MRKVGPDSYRDLCRDIRKEAVALDEMNKRLQDLDRRLGELDADVVEQDDAEPGIEMMLWKLTNSAEDLSSTLDTVKSAAIRVSALKTTEYDEEDGM